MWVPHKEKKNKTSKGKEAADEWVKFFFSDFFSSLRFFSDSQVFDLQNSSG